MARVTSTDAPTPRRIEDFPECVQDLGDVLYDLPPQQHRERYIDFSWRLVVALEEAGYRIVKEA